MWETTWEIFTPSPFENRPFSTNARKLLLIHSKVSALVQRFTNPVMSTCGHSSVEWHSNLCFLVARVVPHRRHSTLNENSEVAKLWFPSRLQKLLLIKLPTLAPREYFMWKVVFYPNSIQPRNTLGISIVLLSEFDIRQFLPKVRSPTIWSCYIHVSYIKNHM